MKKLLVIMLAMSMAFVACKKEEETTPYDNITVAQSQEAFVLLTTATWCGYCGSWGIPTFEGALNGDGGIDATRVNGISLHYSSGSDPMYLEMSQTLKTQYAIGGPPNLWIEFNNAYNLQPSGWENAIKTRQAETATCGVGMYIEAEAGVYTVYVKAQFFSTLSGIYNIAVYAVESDIVATQSGITPAEHSHQNVLRGEITANDAYGTQMFSGSSPEEYTASFTYDPASHITASNVHFVAVIYEMSGGVPVSSPNSNTY